MPSSQARIAATLNLLTAGLAPFVQQELQAEYGEAWVEVAGGSFRNDRTAGVITRLNCADWDAQALLTVMWDQWNAVFRDRLGLLERSLVSELRELRNRWAHQIYFGDEDEYRLMDSAERLLLAISAPQDLLQHMRRLKRDALRELYGKLLEEERRRMKPRYERLTEIILFSVSGLAVVVATLVSLVPLNLLAGLLLIAFTILVFGYLIYQRLRVTPPTHGVHECPCCRKIIYTEVCPYCQAGPEISLTPINVRPLISSTSSRQTA